MLQVVARTKLYRKSNEFLGYLIEQSYKLIQVDTLMAACITDCDFFYSHVFSH